MMIEYEYYNQIGDKGGFGEVYKCKKIVNGIKGSKSLAMKILKKDDFESVERFKKEVRILEKLNHPRIVKVLDSNLEDDELFYIMPIYKCSMRDRLSQINEDYHKIYDVFNAIFDGVEYLHNEGIYHRDLKPENVLINSYTDLVISDLGLGFNSKSASERLTKTGYKMGSLFYMSPEQMSDSKHIDHRTDIYSLGKMIYECITLECEMVADISKVPSGLKYIVSKCLKKNPDERYQNIEDLRIAFNSAMSILIDGKEINDFESVVKKILSTDKYDELVKELVQTLEKSDIYLKQDKIHDMFMKLPLDAIKKIYEENTELTLELLGYFVDCLTGQAWPFNYTDSIGLRCKKIYKMIDNIEMKAKLIYCIGKVGIYHNRFYVLDIFKKLLEDVSDDDIDLAVAIIGELDNIGRVNIYKLSMNLNKLNPIIGKWLRNN